jgi:hypothetical protein
MTQRRAVRQIANLTLGPCRRLPAEGDRAIASCCAPTNRTAGGWKNLVAVSYQLSWRMAGGELSNNPKPPWGFLAAGQVESDGCGDSCVAISSVAMSHVVESKACN